MRLGYLGEVEVGDMDALFPRQLQPPISVTDFLGSIAPGAMPDVQGIKFDPLLACAYAEPLFVPFNQSVTDPATMDTVTDRDLHMLQGAPVLFWPSFIASEPRHTQNYATTGWGFQTIDVQIPSASAPAAWLDARTANTLAYQGILVFLSHTLYTRVPENAPTYREVSFWITANGTTGDWYRISWSSNRYPVLEYMDRNSVTWTTIKQAFKTGSSPAGMMANSNPGNLALNTSIEVMVLNGQILLSIMGEGAPYIAPLMSSDYNTAVIGQVIIKANYFTHIGFSAHPMVFAATGTYTSIPHQFGFVPSPDSIFHYLLYTPTASYVLTDGLAQNVADGTVEITTTPNTAQTAAPQYDLVLSNTTFANFNDRDFALKTVVINRVVTHVDGFAAPPTNAGVAMLIGTGIGTPVRQVREHLALDMNQLTIQHSCEVTLDNWLGIDSTSVVSGIQGVGNASVGVQLGWQHTGTFPRFIGFAHSYVYSRPGPNLALLTMNCADQMMRLSDRYIAAPPNMDGWNHYYAVAWLASYAGININQMAFSSFVPDDPFTSVPADENPYFLPLGQGINPWTPVNRTLSVLQLLDFIRKVTGFLIYFDATGLMRYELWIPGYDSSGYPKRVFTEVDGIDAAGEPTAIWSLMAEASTLETRNRILTVGIDAFAADWPAIINKIEDSDSIWSAPGTQPKNYVGYPKDFIWLDSRFANQQFAQEAAQRLYTFLRQPTYTVEFTAWAQWDLYPMDLIWVIDSKSNTGGVPFYITEMDNVLSTLGGNIQMTSRIKARYLEPSAFVQ